MCVLKVQREKQGETVSPSEFRSTEKMGKKSQKRQTNVPKTTCKCSWSSAPLEEWAACSLCFGTSLKLEASAASAVNAKLREKGGFHRPTWGSKVAWRRMGDTDRHSTTRTTSLHVVLHKGQNGPDGSSPQRLHPSS